MHLNELRKELRFNGELVQLIETLKNIAGSQYHTMEKAKQRFEHFMDAFSGFFRVVNLANVDDPLVRAANNVTCMIIVTSDSGFMGGLNQGVIRAAFAALKDRAPEDVRLVVIGEKGASALQDQQRTFHFMPGVSPERIYERALEIKDYLVGEVLAGRMGRVMIAYPKPVSFTAQTIDVISLLPCTELFDVSKESEVTRRLGLMGFLGEARQVIVESSFRDMAEYLAGMWVAAKLYEVFEDSKLAEFSARAMHLEGSFQKLQKDKKKLRHMTFKAIHERIDKGMRESFAARTKHRVRGLEPIEDEEAEP